MSFRIGSLIGNLVKDVEGEAKKVGQDIGNAAQKAEKAVTKVVDGFESNETVKQATSFISSTVDSFEQAVGLKKKSAEPATISSNGRTPQYTDAPGPLFTNGPSATDVIQGETGDCYFLSSMASVAQSHPELIKNAITQNKDGTYTVTFHVPPGFDAMKALGPLGGLAEGQLVSHFDPKGNTVKVTVDGKLPDGGDDYAQESPDGERWPQIFEKAYAQLWGSYGAIGNGGDAATALYALTGKDSKTYGLAGDLLGKVGVKVEDDSTSAAKLNQIFNTIKSSAAAGKPMAATTYLAQEGGSQVPGMVEAHVYSLLGTSEHDGQQYVVLRNPWGTQPAGKDLGNGEFEMPLAQFAQQYHDYTVCDL